MKRNILLLCILLTGNNLFGQKDIITFADATVKALCVANWDSDGDGELSKAEAACVTSLGSVFQENGNISSFNELQYFISLTSIGDSAFDCCSGLTSINIPENVTSIGSRVFYLCRGLTSINIPEGVTTIGNHAFYGCSGLTSITIPGTVTNIGWNAFSNCSGLTSITIPNSVTSIGSGAFRYCSGLTSITIPESVTNIDWNAFEYCSGLTSITIPESVTSIGSFAFYRCSGLTSITIPESVTSIGSYAFSYCSGLNSVTINCKIVDDWFRDISSIKEVVLGDSVTSILLNAFKNCSGLTSINIPEGVTTIGDYAFDGCSGLANITFPESVMTIGFNAFNGTAWYNNQSDGLVYAGMVAYKYKGEMPNNTIVVLKNGTKSISSCFYKCSNLFSITIPESVTSIGHQAFEGCSGLTSINIPKGVTSIGNRAFYKCSGLTSINIPESVTSIGSAAFYGCSNLTSITIPESVTSIGSSTFSGCSNLTSITIPESVTNIGDWAFSDCSGLTSVTIPNGVTSIGNDAFQNCSGLTSITIPESVTSIGRWAYYGCSALTAITIPQSVTSIGSNAFMNCTGLTSVTVKWEIPIALPDYVFSNRFYTTLYVPAGCKSAYLAADYWKLFNKIDEIFIIDFADATVKTLCVSNWDTDGDGELTNAEAASVTSLEGVFGNNSKIIYFNELQYFTALRRVDVLDFYGCSGLTSITIPESVTNIGNYAFNGCSGLTSITIPESVTNIGNYAFNGCSGLTSITIPESVTNIGNYAFDGCSGLTSISIPKKVTSIGYYAFAGCNRLTSVTVEWKMPIDIVNTVFSNRTYATLYVPFGCKSAYLAADYWKEFKMIDDGSFDFADATVKALCVANWDSDGDGELSKAEAASVTSLGSVFKFNTGIKSFNELQYFTGLRAIQNAFNGCSGLTSIIIPESVTSIDSYAFRNCSGLTSITIPNSVTSIGNYAFYGCSGLTSITIPDGVTNIGDNAFSDCRALTSITIPEGVTSIGRDAFYGCRALSSITIPKSVMSIGKAAFSGCSGLTVLSVESGNAFYDSRNNCNAIIHTETNALIAGCQNTVIPESVTNIGDYAFYGCSGLTSITIPENVTNIGHHAFASCSGLTSITIPESVTNIDWNAFAGCSGLTSITIPGSVTSIDDFTFYSCSSLTSITIPESVTSIGDYAFRGCSGLTSITIPEGVTSIGDYAFDNCSSLKTVIVNSIIPISISAFTFYDKDLLYVPLDCGDTYKTADVWKDFKEIRELGTELTLVDGESYNRSTNTNALVEELHYSRTFKNTKWQAWYVPFDLTLTGEIMEHFSFAKFAGTYTEEDGSFYITVVRLKEGDVVKANTPYCVQAKVADSSNPQMITQTNATLKAAEENSFYVLSARKKITFQGNYARRTVTADDQNWYALSGGQYSRQLPGNTIAPYRCFFTIEDREDNPYASTPNPATVKLMVLGEETGITEKKGEEQREKGSDEVFDLNGHRINQQNMRKGIYIVNGKKVFVK